MAKLLFFAANPLETERVRLDEECRDIEDGLAAVPNRPIAFKSKWSVRVQDLQRALLEERPEFVHFSAHGDEFGRILLENTNGASEPVEFGALTEFFRVFRDCVRCVVLSYCDSDDQARELSASVDCVVGMRGSVSHGAALAFATSFYQALAFGKDIAAAFELGRVQIQLQSSDDGDIPQLHFRDGIDTFTIGGTRVGETAPTGGVAQAMYPEARVTVPQMVAHYVARPEAEIERVRTRLLTGQEPVTALNGMGGIGKTVLAQAICREEAVRRAFPDGIVWTTAGRQPAYDVSARMREIVKALGEAISDSNDALATENRYKAVIADKAVLLVIDDVWNKGDLDPFVVDSSRSKFLFTSRDASIARFVGASAQSVDLLGEANSRLLLAAWAGIQPQDLPLEADDIISECGNLPLALAMVGAILRDAAPIEWRDTLDRLRSADMTAIEAQLPPGQPSAFRAVAVSVAALSAELRSRYISLAIMPEDTTLRVPVLATLWNCDESEVRRIGRSIADRSLARRDFDGSLALHDLQHDYLYTLYPEHQALPLIREAIRLSARVIEKYPKEFPSQMVGRLLLYDGIPSVGAFVSEISRSAPRIWLRPLRPSLAPPGTGLVRIIDAHGTHVNAFVMDGAGRRAVITCEDRTIRTLDVSSGREESCKPISSHLVLLAASADLEIAIASTPEGAVSVWNLDKLEQSRVLDPFAGSLRRFAVSADGKLAAFSSGNELAIWDLVAGIPGRVLSGHVGEIVGVSLTYDGGVAVTSSRDKTLRFWDTESGRELLAINDGSDGFSRPAISGNGQCVIAASATRELKVWDVSTGREVLTLEGLCYAGVPGVAVSSDAKRALSVRDYIRLWDLESGRALAEFGPQPEGIGGVSLSADGRRALSLGWDGTLKVWDTEKRTGQSIARDHNDSVQGISATPTGSRAVSVDRKSAFAVWEITSQPLQVSKAASFEPLVSERDRQYLTASGVAISADGRWAVSLSGHRTLDIWELPTGRYLGSLPGHSLVPTAAAVDAVSRIVISASADKTLNVWHLRGGLLKSMALSAAAQGGLAMAGDGKRALSGTNDGVVTSWDLENGVEIRKFTGLGAGPLRVQISADGRRAASGSFDGVLRYWDLDRDDQPRGANIALKYCADLAISPSLERAVTISESKRLMLWEVATGRLLATYTTDAAAFRCSFCGDQMVIVGDHEGRLHFLSIEEGWS